MKLTELGIFSLINTVESEAVKNPYLIDVKFNHVVSGNTVTLIINGIINCRDIIDYKIRFIPNSTCVFIYHTYDTPSYDEGYYDIILETQEDIWSVGYTIGFLRNLIKEAE